MIQQVCLRSTGIGGALVVLRVGGLGLLRPPPVVLVGESRTAPKASPNRHRGPAALKKINRDPLNRRGENLQSVPLRSTAITQEPPAGIGVKDMTSLTAAVGPGLDFFSAARTIRLRLHYRGVGRAHLLAIGTEASGRHYGGRLACTFSGAPGRDGFR